MRVSNRARTPDNKRRWASRTLPASTIVLGLLLMLSASAQEKTDDSKPSAKSTRIVLGSDSGEPGMSVTVPIYFSPAEETAVARLKIDVKFVSRNLKFSRFENGIVAESGNLEMHTDLKEEKDEQGLEYSILTIDADQQQRDSPKAIESGLLGYITFQINKDGRSADIMLRVSAEGTELGSNKPVKNINASDGKIRVLAPGSIPLVSCFFFSH